MEEAMTMPHILQVFPPPLLVFVLPRARLIDATQPTPGNKKARH